MGEGEGKRERRKGRRERKRLRLRFIDSDRGRMDFSLLLAQSAHQAVMTVNSSEVPHSAEPGAQPSLYHSWNGTDRKQHWHHKVQYHNLQSKCIISNSLCKTTAEPPPAIKLLSRRKLEVAII